ncbi:MAG: TaqI-like C-terminal specificity domain-containing protein [Bacteroidota bacterium]|nr:TaqI-like C-terminal specificity domain-containing protein [Bacteroidota bacterium]
MIEELISNISRKSINDFFRKKISSYRSEEEDLDHLLDDQEREFFSNLMKLGECEYPNSDQLLVFSCKYNGELSERNSKKRQFEIAKKVLREDFKDGAVFIFYDDQGKFRFSFIRKNYGDRNQKYTPWRRYTYFIDPERYNKTFRRRVGECTFNSLDEIQASFSVEPLSKNFYKELSHWYFWSISQVEFPNDNKEDRYNLHANAMIRLITRLMFVWFMKQKKLVPDDLFQKEKIDELINYEDSTGSTYYKAILQNLFFATLNTPIELGRKFVNRQYGVQGFYRYSRFIKDQDKFLGLMETVPFLNGGLFENLDRVRLDANTEIRIDCFSDRKVNESRLKVPDYLFFGTAEADLEESLGSGYKHVKVQGLIDILNQYDFTIDENTPYDQEVALDPELLGMVFENLLASYNPETQNTARKESGSFYTPRPIVDYMVEESLAHHIATDTGLDLQDVRLIFGSNDDQPLTDEKAKKAVIQSISNLKIIDPACGSGAFPMGALQKMVHALSKLDPDNKLWRASQKERLMQETFNAFENTDLEDLKKQIDDIFDNELNDPDYARKLYLIENCLYGLDIQPIAMQISKLRFFISLLVEQKIDRSKENFGILALPNLETKFVAANSLIKLNKPVSGKTGQANTLFLKNLEIERKEKELEKVRHQYFTARTPKTKEKRREEDKKLRAEISEILLNDGWNLDEAHKIAAWDPFNPNDLSQWFDPEWMFGVQGFDIVIGNPPYISLQRMPDTKALAAAQYDTYEKTGDLYSLFYERGIELLQPNGFLCYITSNKWINANYGKSTRKYLLSKSNPITLIDFAKVKIFESATVFVNILLTQRHKNQNNLEACAIRGDHLPKQHLRDYFDQNKITLNYLDENIWKVNNAITHKINIRLEKQGTQLKEWPSINFFRGITTGYNTAFHIEEQDRINLVSEDKKSDEIIKPLLRGKDIKRWGYQFNNWYIINSHNGLKNNSNFPPVDVVNNYPAVYNHLLQFEKELITRQDQGDHWTNLRDCAFLLEFDKPKIVWIEISDRANYTFDDAGMFLTNSAYFISGENLKYILAILNSKVADFYFFQVTATIAGGRKRYTKQYVEQIPIPQISEEDQAPFVKIVDYLLELKRHEDLKGQKVMMNHFEQVLNAMVYELYFEELVKEKGYDIIKHVKSLPEIESEENLSLLRMTYEETSQKNHPIRESIFLIDSIPEIGEISKIYQK